MEYTLEYIQAPQEMPLLASFPQNIPKEISKLDLKFHSHKKNGNAYMLASHDHQKLIAKSVPLKRASSYLIGVPQADKKIKLMEVKHFFSFEQEKEELLEQNAVRYEHLDHKDKKQILVDTFGTKKSQKKLIQANSNKVEEDNIDNSKNMEKMIQDKKKGLKETKTDEFSGKLTFLPEYNLEAKKADKIYNMTSILSNEDFDLLDISEFQELMNSQNFSQVNYLQPYVLNKLKTQKLNSLKLKYLYYLDMLLALSRHNQFQKTVEEIANEMYISVDLLKNILKKFYSLVPQAENQVKYIRTPQMADKMMCYIMVLGLAINDYKMPDGLQIFLRRLLCSNLKIDNNKFMLYCKEIGCTVKQVKKQDQKEFQVELKAPLKLQKNSTFKK